MSSCCDIKDPSEDGVITNSVYKILDTPEGVSQNLSSVTNDSFCYKLLK